MANYTIIPASLSSKRLPRKLLLSDTGKTLIQHTWENCLKIPNTKTLIATDNLEICDICTAFGADVIFDETPVSCGTARVVAATKHLTDCETVTNVQGEWPFINPNDIQKSVELAKSHYCPLMTSLYYQGKPIENPNVVKVVLGKNKRALYFSRSNIPYQNSVLNYHIGVYTLNQRMIDFYPTLLMPEELKSENLEQLVVLANQFPILMLESTPTYGVDTLKSYEKFVSDVNNFKP